MDPQSADQQTQSAPTYSADGRWWWDGQRWVAVPATPAPPPPYAYAAPTWQPTNPPTPLVPRTVRKGIRTVRLAVGVVAAAATLIGAAATGVARSGWFSPGLADRPSSTVFDDDFSSNRGWDLAPLETFTTVLAPGHPGAIHMTVTEPDAGYGQNYPGAAYERVKITATMKKNSGRGQIGMSCDQSGASGYDLWADGNGSTGIAADNGDPNSGSTRLATGSWAWKQGESHTITAICYSDGSSVNLQLLADGRSLLKASDDRYTGPFKPAVFARGPIDFDLQHFTVATVS